MESNKKFTPQQQTFINKLTPQLNELIEIFLEMDLSLELTIERVPNKEDKH